MGRGIGKLVALAIVLAVSAIACGQDRANTPSSRDATAKVKVRDCRIVGHDGQGTILLCQKGDRGNHGTFVVNGGSGRSVLSISSPGSTATASDAGRVGHWDWAALSPDDSILLAQWSAECEVPIAFFVPAKSGRPRVVSGEEDWATSPSSVALGWTTDGRAIILFPEADPCGGVGSPGLYLVGIDGTRRRIRGLDRFAQNLPRSLRPRSAESLEP